MKKCTICIAAAILLAACSNASSGNVAQEDHSVAVVSASDINMVNPWTEASTVEQAASEAGLEEFTVPEITDVVDVFEEGEQTISYMENIAEVTYENEDNELVIRKGKGTEDVSGVYSDYSEQRDIEVGDLIVHVSGTKGTIHIATWNDGENAYSLTYNIMFPGKGLTEEEVRKIVSEMK